MSSPDPPVTSSNGQPPPSPLRPRKHAWVWFFVILAVLALAAIVILIRYNLSQQLTPERLEKAWKLWEEKRPPNYVLTYTKEGSTTGTVVVVVRDGKVKSVVLPEKKIKNGREETVKVKVREDQYDRHDMSGLFQDLKGFLAIKKKEGTNVFLRASFDPDDGHIREYTYSNSRGRQRIQVITELERE
jgi:hypothetical protein